MLEWMKAKVVGVGKLKEGSNGTTSPQDHGEPWRWERRGWVVPWVWYQGDPKAQQEGLRRWSAVEGWARLRRDPEPRGRGEVIREAELGTRRHEIEWPHQRELRSGG